MTRYSWRVLRKVAAVMALLLMVSVALLAWMLTRHDTGYFGAVFAPDGASVYAIERDVVATVLGFGDEFSTPPARVRGHRDRFSLINIRLADGRVSTVQEFPPTPLQGSTITAYHGAIFSVARGHLRWADGAHLEYSMSVDRSERPFTRTYDGLVAEGKARGLNEGTAMLSANKRMKELGYFPKSPTITARRAACEGVSPVFRISDDEFRVGLFQDIERAIQHPGSEEEKGNDYLRHQSYDTSAKINAYLRDRQDTTFYVEGLGGCWELVVKYYRTPPG